MDHRYAIGIGICAMLSVFSSALVALRFLLRYITRSIKWDDWCCLMALTFAYGNFVATIVSATFGRAGQHIAMYDNKSLVRFYNLTVANRCVYLSSISSSKLSILLFFRRIFGVKRAFSVIVWFVFGLVAAYWIIAEVFVIFSRDINPTESQWRAWSPPGHHRDGRFWIIMGIVNIILDFTILCLPQPLVWRLHMDRKRKIQVSVVLCLGFFVCIASIVRMTALVAININDLTSTLAMPLIWTIFEIHMSIICSCLPLVPGLIRHYRGNSTELCCRQESTGWPSNYHDLPSRGNSESQVSVRPSQLQDSRVDTRKHTEIEPEQRPDIA